MKKFIGLLIAVTCVYPLFAQQINDPNAELRQAKNFHAIHVSNAFNVYLDQSNEETVAVSAASTKDRENIIVEVKNGILYISLDKNWNWGGGNKKLKAYISFKQIDKLQISGASDVFIAGVLKADELFIHQSGASDLKGKIEVNKLKVDLSGASDVTISGIARQIAIEASGACDFKGFDLVTEICDVKANGASSVKITVNKELSAHVSGASDVRYKGEGVIKEIKNSGASSVSKG